MQCHGIAGRVRHNENRAQGVGFRLRARVYASRRGRNPPSSAENLSLQPLRVEGLGAELNEIFCRQELETETHKLERLERSGLHLNNR